MFFAFRFESCFLSKQIVHKPSIFFWQVYHHHHLLSLSLSLLNTKTRPNVNLTANLNCFKATFGTPTSHSPPLSPIVKTLLFDCLHCCCALFLWFGQNFRYFLLLLFFFYSFSKSNLKLLLSLTTKQLCWTTKKK